MTTLRFASVVLVLSLWFGVGLSAQYPGQSSLRRSAEREALRLAQTLVADHPSSKGSISFNTSLTQTQQPGDWDAVRQLEKGTHVRVSTHHGRATTGSLTTVGDDTLQMVVRLGRKETLSRDDVYEVRLLHGLSVGGYAGLGLLLGGLTGFLAGSAAACDQHVCGGEGGLAIAGGLVQGTFFGGMGGFVAGEMVHHRPERLVYARAKPVLLAADAAGGFCGGGGASREWRGNRDSR